ncbi:MAG TPA: hypothetical protein VN909_04755 [Candidatus Dormibacteraeota bacterium]|nr:hypothetical protein [Candidatus Dormibacteraeota bacterium]
MDRSSSAAAAGLIATFGLIYAILLIAIIAFSIWVYWRIFAKAGYNGALSLLNFIPGIGPLICMIILAFGRWPIEDQLAAAMQGRPIAPTMPPPPPPGSSVMPTS